MLFSSCCRRSTTSPPPTADPKTPLMTYRPVEPAPIPKDENLERFTAFKTSLFEGCFITFEGKHTHTSNAVFKPQANGNPRKIQLISREAPKGGIGFNGRLTLSLVDKVIEATSELNFYEQEGNFIRSSDPIDFGLGLPTESAEGSVELSFIRSPSAYTNFRASARMYTATRVLIKPYDGFEDVALTPTEDLPEDPI